MMLAMIILLISLPALAANESDGWLSITIGDANSDFERGGVYLAAYLVATGDYGNWTMVEAFKSITVYSRDDGSAWIDQSLSKIHDQIQRSGIRPTQTAVSDSSGKLEFKGLEHGIYFIEQTAGPERLKVSMMLLSTPNKAGDVQVRAEAKFEVETTPSPTPVTTTTKPTFTPFETPTPVNTPDVTPTPTPKPTRKPVPTPTPEPHPYRIIIHYIYEDGTKAWDDWGPYTLWPGENYDKISPEIPGYTPDHDRIYGVMPHRDLEFTVIYVKREQGKRLITLDDYETALGLGNIQMHVGVCFE